MSPDEARKTVIITGGAGGIGLAAGVRLLAAGANVVLADISAARLAEAVATLSGLADPARIATSVCDVADEEQVRTAVHGALSHFGRLDVVVNNAGLMVFKSIQEHTGGDWMRILGVDLLGAFFFTKHAFLNMPQGGAIINISSIHAVETEPMVACYAAAKAALLSLTRSAALEGKPKGIRVNAILPGALDTPMLWDNPYVRAGIEVIDKKDVGQPADVAEAIAWLASDAARFV
jgi:NAD(P)-dependent dehydrogenase (short-subunit alcohol dehydrogenase family)